LQLRLVEQAEATLEELTVLRASRRTQNMNRSIEVGVSVATGLRKSE